VSCIFITGTAKLGLLMQQVYQILVFYFAVSNNNCCLTIFCVYSVLS